MRYQYLKLRASRYPSHCFAAGPSRSHAHGRPWFPIPIPKKVLCDMKLYTEGTVPIVYLEALAAVFAVVGVEVCLLVAAGASAVLSFLFGGVYHCGRYYTGGHGYDGVT